MHKQSTHTGSRRAPRWHICALLGAALAVTALGTALAQAPGGIVKMILPVAAGSGVDIITRTAAPALSKALGETVVAENLPGAGGIIGTQALVKAPPDGRTLSVVSNNHVILPSVYKTLPFDPIKDITPIAVVGATPMVLVVNPKLPAHNLKELIALLKTHPGQYNYGSSGNGTILQLATELFKQQAGVDIKHVPYKGVGPMLSDLMGGQVQLATSALPTVQQQIRAGTLRAIGVASPQRVAAAPDIPTMAEQGLPGYVVEGWFAVVGPKGLPPAEVKRVHDAVVQAFNAPEVREAMAKQGNTIAVTTPQAAADYFRSEMVKYAQLVKQAGVQVQ